MVLVGPSGCGKTTVLRMVAGLEDLTDGTIRIGGRVVNEIPPGDRDIAMVFQNYALYPHMTVYQNMALSLKIHKVKKDEMNRRVQEAAAVLHLEEILHKRPRELSGGQRQRVAMGRAIVREPQAFLMDEPLSNLDAKLRVQMRAEILPDPEGALQVTTIYVTHDQTEAMTLGDRVAVMRKGVLQQVATPQELYAQPVNLFVGGFIGSPAMNLVEARSLGTRTARCSRVRGHRAPDPGPRSAAACPALAAFRGPHGRSWASDPRPWRTRRSSPPSDPDSRFPIDGGHPRGHGLGRVPPLQPRRPPRASPRTRRELASDIDEKALQDLKEQASERRTDVHRADRSRDAARRSAAACEIHVDTRKLYFFDPATGDSIEWRPRPSHPMGASGDAQTV